MTTLQDIDQMIDEFIFKHLISDTGIICNSDIVEFTIEDNRLKHNKIYNYYII